MTYENHPAANLFPMMSDSELAELAKDIRENGLLERIVIHDGMILDGRNRLKACELAGAEPLFCNPQPPVTSPTIYVISKNLHRRHLTVGQRAAIAAEIMPLLREEAKQRQATSTGGREPHLKQLTSNSPEAVSGETRKIAGDAVGVGAWSVQKAANLRRDDPETFEKVKRGEITINAAASGHKEQPKLGGDHAPKDVSTKRGKERAEAHKRRMVTVLSECWGMCSGLTTLDVALMAAVCTGAELDVWAKKAESSARELRKFAGSLRSFNGESQSGTEREDEGGCSDNSSDSATATESASPEASL